MFCMSSATSSPGLITVGVVVCRPVVFSQSRVWGWKGRFGIGWLWRANQRHPEREDPPPADLDSIKRTPISEDKGRLLTCESGRAYQLEDQLPDTEVVCFFAAPKRSLPPSTRRLDRWRCGGCCVGGEDAPYVESGGRRRRRVSASVVASSAIGNPRRVVTALATAQATKFAPPSRPGGGFPIWTSSMVLYSFEVVVYGDVWHVNALHLWNRSWFSFDGGEKTIHSGR